ncbi:Hypothetical protein ACGLYG10_1000 [Actinomyces glycerinitolerans]|uniref:Uncharacterized protein n=1 Tax=Actinomyces glycerinitolerans TaxID=1892869 RepID=A0A1M4RXX7_9ACTO|nr:Hypothetical protein ACGLYG10_1000 [Actinomyces glycerinitolerans]
MFTGSADCGCGGSGPRVVVVGRTRSAWGLRGRSEADEDMWPAGSCSGWRGRPRPGRDALAAAGRSARGRGLNLHGAGSSFQAWLHLAADSSGARERGRLLRRVAVCYATSGLTTPVNRLLKAPEVYSRALSSVVNAQPAHQTPHATHPTPCHVPGHRQHSCRSPRQPPHPQTGRTTFPLGTSPGTSSSKPSEAEAKPAGWAAVWRPTPECSELREDATQPRLVRRNSVILSHGMAPFSPPSYRSVWEAPGMETNSLLSPCRRAKASLPM